MAESVELREQKLKAAIKREVAMSQSYLGGEISAAREEAMERYLGEPYGNEIEGRSQVVSTDVQDTIESILPDFMELFGSGDRICTFDPHSPEDEPFADQAADYVNYVYNKDNCGFEVTYDLIKDALLLKNGFVKTYWDESTDISEQVYENVNSMSLAQLEEDDEIEVIEQEQVEVTPEFAQVAPDGLLYDIKIRRTRKRGRARVEVLPPEEVGFSRYAPSIYDAGCVYHKTEKTISDLIEMGFDYDDVKDLPSDDEQLFNQERLARFADEDDVPPEPEPADSVTRKVWVYEVYIRFDWDGDNIAEWRQVFCAGSSYKILSNESVPDQPIDTITPIRMPHKVFGRSVADLVLDIALIKTTVQRQILDNMYGLNNNRMFINEDVNLDDYMTMRPGGPVRVRGSTPATQAAAPIPITPLGPVALGVLEYFESVREGRTGVTRYNQGLDAESLNETASGMNMILGRAQQRVLLIARLFAETGFKRIMMRILKLLIAHQDAPRTIRLRNKWVQMDPRPWNANMDATVAVGIGQGTAQAKQGMLMNILGIQKQVLEMQGGTEGPLVTLDNIFNTLDHLAKTAGYRNGDMFFSDPKTDAMKAALEQQKQNRAPDPKIVEVQLTDKRERDKMQIEAQERMARLQHDKERAMSDYQARMAENASKREIEMARLKLDQLEIEIKAAEAGEKLRIEQHNAITQGQSAKVDRDTKIAQWNKDLLDQGTGLDSPVLLDTVRQLQDLAAPLAAAANRVTSSKEFIKDANGDIVAVRHQDGTVQQVTRDGAGNMTGLKTVQ